MGRQVQLALHSLLIAVSAVVCSVKIGVVKDRKTNLKPGEKPGRFVQIVAFFQVRISAPSDRDLSINRLISSSVG